MLNLIKNMAARLKTRKNPGRKPSVTSSRRARLGIETLEDRQLMTTGVATLPIVPPMSVQTASLQPALLAPTVQKTTTALPAPIASSQPGILATTVQKPSAPMTTAAAPQLASTAVSSRVVQSVITIRNMNNFSVTYYIQWPGYGWQSYSIGPIQYRLHYLAKSGARPLISFDNNFAAGYQEQRYALPSKAFVTGGKEAWVPKYASDGMIYDFRLNAQRTGVTVVMNNALDTTRYASLRSDIKTSFPSVGDRFEILGPSTGGPTTPGSYNCIAWSMGLVNQWVWTGEPTDPRTGEDKSTLQGLFNQYLQRGFHMLTSLDYSYHAGQQKVVVYGHYDSHHVFRPTHGSLQMSDGTWTSKCGGLALIRHLTPDVFGDWNSPYGRPVAVFVRNG